VTQQLITLRAECDLRQVACEVASQRTVEWSIAATAPARPTDRAALNLALILDRSGSMSGEKLRYVQQAALHVIDLLDARDRVALVAYDDRVTLLSPSEPVTDSVRAELKSKIQQLTPGGWTDLSGGWLEGCRQIAEHQAERGINRALLLTDGLANRGITDSEELAHHARQLCQRGVLTSTFGVGLDFNEHLLEALANHGGGHFYYIERPDQIPDVFRRELGELLSIVAHEALLRIEIPRGVAIELLGDLPHEREQDRLRIYLGDLHAGSERTLYSRVLTPPDAPGTGLAIRAELGYADLDGKAASTSAEILFSYAREAEVRLLPANTGVLQRAGEVELAAAATRALKLERAGRQKDAQAVLHHTLAAAAPFVTAQTAAAYQSLSGNIADGLSEEQRKQAQFDAYKKRNSRD
jgi:Ca-activated chloride channel family protein